MTPPCFSPLSWHLQNSNISPCKNVGRSPKVKKVIGQLMVTSLPYLTTKDGGGASDLGGVTGKQQKTILHTCIYNEMQTLFNTQKLII